MLAALVAASVTAATIAVSRPLPLVTLIDESGQRVQLGDAFRGRVLIVSFFTRGGSPATDCSAIAGKFLYLQRQLPVKDYHLVLITRAPTLDSPQRLRQYANAFGADPLAWSFLTGDARQIQKLVRALSVNRESESKAFEPLFVIDRRWRLASSLPASDWSPEDAIAAAREVVSRSP